jgi:TRAP-type mannitol/chloroaromatic compound transport system permease large subunit
MSVLSIGLLYGTATLVVMFAGMPIAFALGAVATVFMIAFMPASSVDTIAQNVYEEMASITLLSIPLFILKGAAIGQSRAGQDLYGALHAWMHRIPGGLGIANIFACALFAAMAGSSPATCFAIGSAGIPEMRKRGYSGRFASGLIAAGGTLGILLPPSITMILYARPNNRLAASFSPLSAPRSSLLPCSPATPCGRSAASIAPPRRCRKTPASIQSSCVRTSSRSGRSSNCSRVWYRSSSSSPE